MSDYTQTPNLSLYKPTYNADAEQWGNHLNSNADVLDAHLATSGGTAVFLPLAGGTLTGALTLYTSSPSGTNEAASKGYVDTHTLGQAPNDANTYGRSGTSWVGVVPISGNATMTGPLTLSADPPAGTQQAATAHYVDNAVGAYLPLAGGTVTGATTFAAATTLSAGGTFTGTFGGNPTLQGSVTIGNSLVVGGTGFASTLNNFGRGSTFNWSGSTPSSAVIGQANVGGSLTGVSEAAYWGVITGNAAVNAPGALVDQTNMVMTVGGASAASAGWNTLSLNLNDSAATNDKAGGGAGAWVALQIARRASQNQGGTGVTAQTAYGQNWGIDVVNTLISGATNIGLQVGIEVNNAVQSGASVFRRAAIQMSSPASHVVRGTYDYGLLALLASGAATYRTGIGFGGGLSATAPLGSDSYLLSYRYAQDATANADTGILFSDVTFTTAAFRSKGFTIDGAGTVRIGTGYLTATGAGLSVDAKGSIGTGTPTINAGGSGWLANEFLDDAYGGTYRVTTVSAGAITAVSVLSQPVYPTTSPPATLAVSGRYGSVGTGAVLNITWNTGQTTLALSPGAGPTTVGGTLTATGSIGGAQISTTGTTYLQAGTAVTLNNVVRISPTAAGGTPSISLLGPDADIGLNLSPAGAGVVVAPRISSGANFTFSGAFTSKQSPHSTSSNLSGSATDNYRNLIQHTVNADNAATSGTAIQAFAINHNFGGAAMTGGRIAFAVNLTQTAATNNTVSQFYQGGQFSITGTQSEPGAVMTRTGSKGIAFGLSVAAGLSSTATNWSGVAGMEIDVGAAAQPYSLLGISVVRLPNGGGTQYQAFEPSLDTAFKIGGGTSVGFINGYTVTSPTSNWAIDPTQGTLFKAFPGSNYGTSPPAALNGIDLSYVGFAGNAWLSRGARIGPNGNGVFSDLTLGNWTAAVSSSGLAINSPNQIALTAAISAAGTGYNVNEQFAFAGNGRGMIAAATGGVPTAVTILEYPTAASPPANPVATTSLMFSGAGQATGSGLTLTLTWSIANTLSLNSSGGATTVGGTLTVTGGVTTGAVTASGVLQNDRGLGAANAGFGSYFKDGNAGVAVNPRATANYGNPIVLVNDTVLLAIGSAGTQNAAAALAICPYTNTATGIRISSTGTVVLSGNMGFNGATAVAKPTVSGAKGSNAALASLMTALAAYGLVTDSTTA